jgi:hypothetical protein
MKFRKKPVVIEAEQWFPGKNVDGVEEFDTGDPLTEVMGRIVTLEDHKGSTHYVSPGDWVITGVAGEKYACKDPIFKATYDPVEPEVPDHLKNHSEKYEQDLSWRL